ncbi:MAG TPA: hypothetical protein VFV42_12610 [Acidimicrobiales bacterium]|nr:hypothetical protein [Acidimicrobiales bacterium]
MRRLLTGLLGLALLSGACSGDDDDGDRAAVTSVPEQTTTSSTTTEPEVPPVDVIPQDVSLITEEYVENVLNALFDVDLEAVKMARSEGVVDKPAIQLLEATTSAETALQRINDLIDLSVGGFEGMSEDPSALTFEVREVLSASQLCMFAEVVVDSSGMFPASQVPDGAREFVRLLPATEEQLTTGLNPTAWALDEMPVTLDGSVPEERCPS